MKNRKTVVVAFLLVAAMLMSVGYAALTDTLTLIGNATIDMNQAGNNFDAKIEWVEAVVMESPNKSADTATVEAPDDATFAVHSLATKGDSAVLKFTIANNSNVDVKVTVTAESETDTENKFGVAYEYSNTNMVIPQGETMDVFVTISVVNPVTEAAGAIFNMTYKAETTE